MGSTWALVCSTTLVLALLSSAAKDEPNIEQHEIPFDLDLRGIPQPDSMMLQKEVDLTDLIDPKEFLMQKEMDVPPFLLNGQSSFGPRSFGGPPTLNYPVQFPLSRPTSDNIQAVCLHGDHRPRYPSSYFPPSGFGQNRRMATAVNNAESWFGSCCKRNQTWEGDMMLCCATQAWELSLELFCEENSRVKDRQHLCCSRDNGKLDCFNEAAENPSYEPTEVLPVESLPPTVNFSFDPSTCQRKLMTPYSVRVLRKKKEKKPSTSQKIDINFPPGRPTADNIELLCSNQKLRPLYNTKCLPRFGYELLAVQAKTINRLEKGFKQCCKKKHGVLTCADQKWRDELNKFCSAASNKQGPVDLQCCLGDEANDQYTCFQQTSPDPNYNMTSASEKPSLSRICDTHSIIRKRFPVGFPLTTFVSQCCPLPDEERASCSEQKLEEISQNLCPPKKPSPAVRRCCKTASREAVPQCISKIIMDAINKATNVLRQKKRKRCPIS
ncbi:extracellular matrix protein 1-like isoform X2 [Melanotaenia boesemani]|uniref:extracellular matrix protein 1-like isoform X2 n=1 Tax=Melanotaenia boesemani TaxID=1250792 RepID=UPI001C04C23C|nr:extracellular matrix protein 1-like isoform X2 [Melanotaenia boesemani]